MKMGFGKLQITSILQRLLFAETTTVDASVENHIERSFQVTPGGRLTVDSDRGSIEVRTVDRDLVDIKIERTVKQNGKWSVEEVLEDCAITFDHSNDGVTISAKYKHGNPWRRNRERNRLQVKFLITVPQQYAVDLKTLGGGISVEDLEGEVLTRTSGGGLRIGRIKGSVWGRTARGSIEVEGVEGDADVKTAGAGVTIGNVVGVVEAKTAGGSIHIDKAAGSINAKTFGGNITVEEVMGRVNVKTFGGTVKAYISRQPEGDCSLEATGGNVTAHLAEGIAVAVAARSDGGCVTTDVSVTTVGQGKISRDQLQGVINGGGPQLKLRTFGGSINLRKKPIVESENSTDGLQLEDERTRGRENQI